jgi:hypothetical protein
MSVDLSVDVMETVRAKFNFSVDKFPLAGPDGLTTPWYGLFRSDTSEVVGNGSVSNLYVPHTTDDVLALCEASSVAFDGVADVECYFREGHHVMIRPEKSKRLDVFGTADNVWPRVVISAGFDGKAFAASIGSWRDLCRNMRIFRCVKESTVRIRHMSGLRHKMQELIDTFGMLSNSWDSVCNLIQRMESNQVNLVNFLDEIYGKPAETKRAITEHKDRTTAIVNRLMGEQLRAGRVAMGSDFIVTGWEAFNAVQGYVQHEVTRKGRNKNDSGAKLLLSLNDTDVAKAELLAIAA